MNIDTDYGPKQALAVQPGGNALFQGGNILWRVIQSFGYILILLIKMIFG